MCLLFFSKNMSDLKIYVQQIKVYRQKTLLGFYIRRSLIEEADNLESSECQLLPLNILIQLV